VLTLVPGSPDAEHRPAATEHVEGGDDLGEQTGMPVGDPGDQQPELDVAGLAGEEAQRGVALEHRLRWSAELLHLEVVVHHRQRRDAALVGGPGDLGERAAECRRTAWPGQVSAMQGQLHGAPGGRCL
jgi:hypothetical protein